jgi:hypothetical protein
MDVMARNVGIEKPPMHRGRGSVGREIHRGPLPDPLYYLNNFQTVLASLDARYAELLSPEERQFIAHFGALPQAPRALLVRMVMRRGVFFRLTRLNYAEIGETSSAMAPLLDEGWVEVDPFLDVKQLQQLLTKAELIQHFSLSRQCRKLQKSELVNDLRAQYPESLPFSAWCPESTDRLYHLTVDPLCEVFRLLFFGNFHQDWTEFVLTDLGVLTYEKIPASLHSLAFRTRAHIDAFCQLHRGRRSLEGGLPLDEIMSGIPPPITDCDWLEEQRQKLLFQVSRAHEKRGDATSALAVLSACTHRGARLRSIRLHERAHEWEMARDLCITAQESPENETERQQLRRLLSRLNRKLGVAVTKPRAQPGIPTFDFIVDTPTSDCAVEYLVRELLSEQACGDSTIHYVENTLINSLFGLLCWRAIFAPVPGAFFHEFQYAPADLLSGQFYQRRQREFAACFSELESDQYKATMRQQFAAKAGIQCPFVAWGALSRQLLDRALRCFPAAHLRLWFEWIGRDVPENRAGFPDLVQFWPREQRYRMIEVKGPGDRLQDNQRRLLEFCTLHRMPVSVCYVRWAGS